MNTSTLALHTCTLKAKVIINYSLNAANMVMNLCRNFVMLPSSLGYWKDSWLDLCTTANLARFQCSHKRCKQRRPLWPSSVFFFYSNMNTSISHPYATHAVPPCRRTQRNKRKNTCRLFYVWSPLWGNIPPSSINWGGLAAVINWHGFNVNPGADPPSLKLQWIFSYESGSDKLAHAPSSARHPRIWERQLNRRTQVSQICR